VDTTVPLAPNTIINTYKNIRTVIMEQLGSIERCGLHPYFNTKVAWSYRRLPGDHKKFIGKNLDAASIAQLKRWLEAIEGLEENDKGNFNRSSLLLKNKIKEMEGVETSKGTVVSTGASKTSSIPVLITSTGSASTSTNPNPL